MFTLMIVPRMCQRLEFQARQNTFTLMVVARIFRLFGSSEHVHTEGCRQNLQAFQVSQNTFTLMIVSKNIVPLRVLSSAEHVNKNDCCQNIFLPILDTGELFCALCQVGQANTTGTGSCCENVQCPSRNVGELVKFTLMDFCWNLLTVQTALSANSFTLIVFARIHYYSGRNVGELVKFTSTIFAGICSLSKPRCWLYSPSCILANIGQAEHVHTDEC